MKKKESFRVDSMPFDLGFYEVRPSSIPQKLPFELQVDKRSGLIYQPVTAKLRRVLNTYYEHGGYLSTPLGEGVYAEAQGDFFLRGLENVIQKTGHTISESRFLEIGCSYGYVLSELRKKGARDVLGIEPGEEGVVGSKRWNVPIIQDFFPTDKIHGKIFDVILSHYMLEHVENPLDLLKEMYISLRGGGIVFFAVPECEKKMLLGDLSIIVHQHINYFTKDTARVLLTAAGFESVGIITSPKRSILFAWGIKKQTQLIAKEASHVSDANHLLATFKKNFQANVHMIQSKVIECYKEGKSIGLYASDANLAGLITYNLPPRLFNTDEKKVGKYIVDQAGPFESLESCVKNPSDAIFIAPIDYDKEIQNDLKRMGLVSSTEIVSIKELYEKQSGVKYETGSASSGSDLIIS